MATETRVGVVQVTVNVYLTCDIEPVNPDGTASEDIREIAQSIVDGERNPMIDHVELEEFDYDHP